MSKSRPARNPYQSSLSSAAIGLAVALQADRLRQSRCLWRHAGPTVWVPIMRTETSELLMLITRRYYVTHAAERSRLSTHGLCWALSSGTRYTSSSRPHPSSACTHR